MAGSTVVPDDMKVVGITLDRSASPRRQKELAYKLQTLDSRFRHGTRFLMPESTLKKFAARMPGNVLDLTMRPIPLLVQRATQLWNQPKACWLRL